MVDPEQPKTKPQAISLWPFVFLVGLIFLTYLPAWNGGLIWDDDAHVTRPGLRSWQGLARIWFDLGSTQQYYPLLHSAFWVQHRLWGDSTLGYHLVNLALHSCATILIAVNLRKLAVPGALLAAAIFALHPVHVESVAWITELKNTLSAVFYLSAMLLYLGFDRQRSHFSYGFSLVCFVLALLSKTVTATLPAALLVIFWWQRGRIHWRRDVLPLVSFFLLGVVGGLFTAWAERTLVGAEGAEYDFSLVERGLIAGRVFWFYLGKLLWPARLVFIYPRWEIDPSVWWQYLFPLAALSLLVGVWMFRKRSRAPLAALLFFAGTLFPVLGFFNVYPFRYSFVADHFQYLASLGIITLFSAGVSSVSSRWRPAHRLLYSGSGLALLGLLALLSWRQCRQYTDIETLYRETIARNPACWLAHNNWGNALNGLGRPGEAIGHFQETLRIKPDYANAHNNWGNSLQAMGQIPESIEHYHKALQLNPKYAEAHNNLGSSLQALGQFEEAIQHCEMALQIRPVYAEAHNNWANALTSLGRPQEAVVHCEEALRIHPDYAEAHNNLANALNALGRHTDAVVHAEAAVRLNPDYVEALLNLGNALNSLKRPLEAVAKYETALRLRPTIPEGHNNLANALNSLGRHTEAVAHCEEALRLSPNYIAAHLNCANALKALGQFAGAARHIQEARRLGFKQ